MQRKRMFRKEGALTVRIELPEQLLDLLLGRVVAERAHDLDDFVGGDCSVVVAVEQRKRLLDD